MELLELRGDKEGTKKTDDTFILSPGFELTRLQYLEFSGIFEDIKSLCLFLHVRMWHDEQGPAKEFGCNIIF